MAPYNLNHNKQLGTYTLSWMKQEGIGYYDVDNVKDPLEHILAIQTAAWALAKNLKILSKEKLRKIEDACLDFIKTRALEEPDIPVEAINARLRDFRLGGKIAHNGKVIDEEEMRVRGLARAFAKVGDKMKLDDVPEEVKTKVIAEAKRRLTERTEANTKMLDQLQLL